MGLKEAIWNIWASDFVQANPKKAYKAYQPAEYQQVAAFLEGAAEPDWSGFTKLGKGLCEAEVERRKTAEPEPEPEPPPSNGLPVRSTNVIRKLTRAHSSHFHAARQKYPPAGSWWQPPEKVSTQTWPNGVIGQTDISTPHGEGFRIICLDAMRTAWAPTTSRMSSLEIHIPPFSSDGFTIGTEQQWDGFLLLPSAGNPSGFSGGWWEGHNVLQIGGTQGGTWAPNGTNGHKLWVRDDGRLAFAIRAVNEKNATTLFQTNDPVALDEWHHIRWETKISTGSDGYHRGWVDGIKIMDHSGPTLFNGETIWEVMMGWYAPAGKANEIHFSEWQVARI